MYHGQIVPIEEVPDAVGPNAIGRARQELTQIVSGIDARFMQAGTALAQAVEAIDAIVAALQEVASVFQEGEAAAAVDNLIAAAGQLSSVSDQVARRSGEVSNIRLASVRLAKHVREVRKALEVLQIYGMNVKIAASGADAFTDFAERMNAQLKAGEHESSGFDVKLDDLCVSLSRMEHHDNLLAIECRRIVPEVPDRLIRDAHALRAHQMKLAELADSTSALARSIQGDVAAILGALQIGDIARQRLEHVLKGCVLLEAYQTDTDSDPTERAATRSHIMRLLAEQTAATSSEFTREAEALVASMRRIQPEASRLVGLQNREGADSEQIFLRGLESGIADAATMVARLDEANVQAEKTLRIIIDTVDDLSGRAAAIRNLRVDVQHMAINIGLRCRRVEVIGRPVMVIANEIRSYSDRLDATIGQITCAATELNAASVRMRDQAEAQRAGTCDDLARSLDAIRESAQHTERAMGVAERSSDGLLDMLRRTTDDLDDSLDLGSTMDAITELLTGCIGPDDSVVDRPDHPVRTLLAEMARAYTMASERVVHDRHLLPEMAALSGPATVSPTPADAEGEDSDGLFDDVLF